MYNFILFYLPDFYSPRPLNMVQLSSVPALEGFMERWGSCAQNPVRRALWTKGVFKGNFDAIFIPFTDLKIQPQWKTISPLVF